MNIYKVQHNTVIENTILLLYTECMHLNHSEREKLDTKKLQIIALSILLQNKPKYNAKCQDSDYSSKGILTKKGNKETF